MKIFVDVGNTTVAIALKRNDEFKTFLVDTKLGENVDFYIDAVKNLLPSDIYKEDIEDIVISSVVPFLTTYVSYAFKWLFKKEPIIITYEMKKNLNINIDHPEEIGNDLIADCVGAKAKYGYPLIIVDLGTATKVLAIDNNGDFIGGSFAPGLELSMKALSNNACLLPNIDLSSKINPIGTNTVDSMNSGILLGHASLVNGLVDEFLKDSRIMNSKIILTGGFSKLLKPLLRQDVIFEKDLIFIGLDELLKLNKK